MGKVGCDIWEKWVGVGEIQKTRSKSEIWEKWGATYGRNGWVGENKYLASMASISLLESSAKVLSAAKAAMIAFELESSHFLIRSLLSASSLGAEAGGVAVGVAGVAGEVGEVV